MQLSHALNPQRIARSLVTVLVLTLIQSVAAPIFVPEISTPTANAVSETFTAGSYPSGKYFVIPVGVTSIRIDAVGGAGGKGGDDGNIGTSGTAAGFTSAIINVNAGDVIGIYPGGKGADGTNSAAGNGGGAKGVDSFPDGYFVKSSNYVGEKDFSGGVGGNAGSIGSSGAGGGGGAASLVTVNDFIALVAGGAGGGGGAGNGSNGAQGLPNNAYVTSDNTLGGNGANVGAYDGGGGGGGGGGYWGGAGGASPYRVTEYSGNAGSYGNNYVWTGVSSTLSNTRVTQTGDGYITYTFNYATQTTCSIQTQTVDIYTVVKVTELTPCTWSVPSTVTTVDVFAVGGGGGGGGESGGGGAGGSALSRTAVAVTPNSSLTLKVGAGGGAGAWGWSVYNGLWGDTSTITLASGVVLSAAGGPGGTGGAGSAGGIDSTSRNGQFAGGAGGRGSTCTGDGLTGKRGVSNYFYGLAYTYAGGGGGGSCPSAPNTAAPGVDGGGTGGYAVSAGNFGGGNGSSNTGGGGGGGTSAGAYAKMHGGRGGSGVILIRYATNPFDAFPASLSSALSARFTPGDLQLLDSSRKGWIDSSGTNTTVSNANITATGLSITTQGTLDSSYSTGSSKSLLVAKGGTSSKITFGNLSSNYSLFHVARFTRGGTAQKLFTASGNNWTSGFFYGEGVSYHYNWLTPDSRSLTYNWQITSDQSYMLRANGIDNSYNRWDAATQLESVNNFGINNYDSFSDFQVADVIVFNRKLTVGEIRLFETYLSRVYGISLNSSFTYGETDTAATLNGANGFYSNYNSGNVLNDTFTIEAWVKPSSACDTTICQIVVRENTLLLGIENSTLRWALCGSNSGTCWNWMNTGVKIPSGEWHHVAMVKQYTGDKNSSLLFYLDGRLVYTYAGSPYGSLATNNNSTSSSYAVSDPDNAWWWFGRRNDGGQRFYGSLDEYKMWKVARSASDIATDMYSNDASAAGLVHYFDFNSRSTTSYTTRVLNIAQNGVGSSDALISETPAYDDVKSVVSSPDTYTTITFPRSYITQYGGWKVPSGISLVQAVVVAGGGGGGGGFEGGGGGAGGFIETITSLIPGNTYQIYVGVGGRGAANQLRPTNGDSSTAFGITTLGGGAGNFEGYSDQSPAGSGGSGGGGSWGHTYTGGTGTSGQGNNGGNSSALNTNPPCSTAVFVGAGGGGAGTAGQDATCTKGGNGGDGKLSAVTGTTLAAGGGGSVRVYASSGNLASSYQGFGGSRVNSISIGGSSAYYDNVAVGATGGATNGKYATGSGGGAGYAFNPSISPYGPAGSGGSGLVALRYITALVPKYTKPSNVTLDVGQTETFTTNVAADSSTASFTRTFKWESITPTSGGAFTTLKVGTGAANAAFGWVPSDTSTSGSGYLYRLTVTDSDTAGLFITDSSTAWATINPAMVITKTVSSNTLVKKINVSRTETYTITLGTPSYRATLNPVIQGITIDTSTAGVVVLKIAETATVGTWAETLTITDSVSASINFPLSITVADPPNLLHTNEIVKNGLILNLEAGNSQSLMLGDTTTATSAVWKDLSGNKKDALTGGASATTYDGKTCTAPKYYTSYGGYIQLNGTTDCFHTDDFGMSIDKSFTVEAWYRSDGTMSAGASILTQNSNGNIGMVLGGANGLTDIRVGIYNGGWYYSSTGFTPVVGVWNHIVGTFNGTAFKLYVNGNLFDSTLWTGGLTGTLNTNGYFIGRRWDGSGTAYYLNGSIGSLRAYNIPLNETQVAQNYIATKFRFKDAPATALKPSKKYGVLTLESFTATSGYDTKTVTFAVGDRLGIDWDATTVSNRINLSVQESLTVGTYYDTITVTDSLGQSTYLPITFTVTKADTLTVTMGSPLTTVYNGYVPGAAPRATVSGLVGVDTATVLTRYDTATVGTTCATGGVCKIGDTGPGGGKVFYISETVINAATGVSEGGVYLEVAPLGWHTTQGQEEALAWSSVTTSVPGTLSSIGAGAENSRLVYSQLGASSAGFNVIVNKTIGGKSDWFVPSLGELEKVYENLWATGLDAFTSSRNMLSSTQDPSNTAQAMQLWNAGGITAAVSKTTGYYMRPIRAFGGTTTPTESDSYTAQGFNLTFGVGAVSNYYNVVYETSTLKITQANQDKLTINLYGAVAGSPFTLQIAGGSGPGAITETVTAGSTALNCRISNRVLSNDTPATEQKTCNISITKASSRNYKAETLTATVYFMVFVNNQPTGLVGSGSTIALNGVTSFETSTVVPPSITGFSTLTLSLGSGGSFTITGTGFTGSITVKFSRNKNVSTTSGDGTTLVIPVSTIASAGASSGRVVVITEAGEAVSDQSLTITP